MKVQVEAKDLNLDEAQKKLFTAQKKEITRLKNTLKRREDKIRELKRTIERENEKCEDSIRACKSFKDLAKDVFFLRTEEEWDDYHHRY